jgi:putative redox protein
MSKPSKQVHVTWVDGMQFSATAESGHSVTMDAAVGSGGEESGFRPTELVLIGLAGCTAMDVVSILKKKRQPVEGLEIRVKGHQVDKQPRYFRDIELEFIVRGNGIAPKAVERAIELSEEKYCSVAATLRGVARITTSFRIEPTVETSQPT